MTIDRHDSQQPSAAESPRRTFLTRLLGVGATFGLAGFARSASAEAPAPVVHADDDPWMKRLSGTTRVLFHSHIPTDGLAISWARTFLDTQKNVYGKQDRDCGVVVGLNGKSIGLLFNDAMWEKYPIAQTMTMTGTQNPNGPKGSDVVAQLTARGVIFLVCQNSLNASGSRFLPESARGDAAQRSAFAVEAKANLLPGVEVVPAMVATLQQAQDRGCRYIYAGG